MQARRAAALIVLAVTVVAGVGPVQRAAAQAPPHTTAREWDEALLTAIRLDLPAPTVHARNLFHLSVAMYDAWAAYDPDALGYLVREKISTAGLRADEIAAARAEAISYAAYRLLVSRFDDTVGAPTTLPALAALMDALGYDRGNTVMEGDSPAALGNRIATAVIAYGLQDGANEENGYEDPTGYEPVNVPLFVGGMPRPCPETLTCIEPGAPLADPNRWQPLSFDLLVLQNGIVLGEAIQVFIGSHWGGVAPFALEPARGSAISWSALDPGPPPRLGGPGDDEFKAAILQVLRFSGSLTPDGETIDLSPSSAGNRVLGTHIDRGYTVNPATGEPYPPNVVPLGDYGRVIAEFWADGPASETPPGHWNVLANEVSDDPRVVKRMGGAGPVLDDLEWDVKLYLALNGAVHDAAVAAWGVKAVYDYVRPITMARYMGRLGQSSEPAGPSYHPDGLPLEDGLVEVITAETTAPGERHAHLAGFEGDIAVHTWARTAEGEPLGVRWIRAVDWFPYQLPTFVTPSFAGYVSGHSTFSRAAAEVLTAFTGSPYFPGGLGTFFAPAGEFLEFEEGPSVDVTLQWATYRDAADEAGISRLYGGIHVRADDFGGRIMGEAIGRAAYALATRYFSSDPSLVVEEASGSTEIVPAPDPAALPGSGNGGLAQTSRGSALHWALLAAGATAMAGLAGAALRSGARRRA